MPTEFSKQHASYKSSPTNLLNSIDSYNLENLDDITLSALVYSFNNLNICDKYEEDFLENESGTLMSSLSTLISVANNNPNIVGIIKSETGEDYSDRLVEPLENLVTKVDGGERQQLQQSIKINEINRKIWSSHRSKILTLTKAVREKATSTVVEEASWLEGFVNEIATDDQISSLMQIHADNDQNLPNVIRKIKTFINANVNDKMGGLPPFDKDNKFNAKASAGKPDVVMRKPDGGLFFSYANYFVDTKMESDQATRHTAMLLETQRVLNSDKSDRTFWDIYSDIKSSDVKTAANEADLWNKILSNPKDYSDLSISISSYQHIDSGSLLDSINKSKDFDLSPNELSDIRMILSSLPILAQDFNNMMPTDKTLGSDMVDALPFIKSVKLCQPENTDTTVTKAQAETKFKAVIDIFSETKNTLLSIIKGMGINRNIGEGKPSGKGIHYVNSNRNLQKVSTKASTEYNINNDMLKGSDFITVLMMSIMEKKANYRQALIEAILQIYSDDRAMILSILPRNDDDLREFEEFLKSENMVSPLSSKDMELNISRQNADGEAQRADGEAQRADELSASNLKNVEVYSLEKLALKHLSEDSKRNPILFTTIVDDFYENDVDYKINNPLEVFGHLLEFLPIDKHLIFKKKYPVLNSQFDAQRNYKAKEILSKMQSVYKPGTSKGELLTHLKDKYNTDAVNISDSMTDTEELAEYVISMKFAEDMEIKTVQQILESNPLSEVFTDHETEIILSTIKARSQAGSGKSKDHTPINFTQP